MVPSITSGTLHPPSWLDMSELRTIWTGYRKLQFVPATMSIIERSNPLHLQYRVCIVTSASSTLGVIVCKTLLKANALVLGVDDHAKDVSLNAGLGTHFQFEQCDINHDQTPTHLIKVAETAFGTDRLDVLVNLVDREDLQGYQSLCRTVGNVMKARGTGSIVNILVNSIDDVDPSMAVMKEITVSSAMKNTRLNLVIPQATAKQTHQDSSKGAYKEAKTYMTALMKSEKIAKANTSASRSKHATDILYDIGNLTLFLVGDMSYQIHGKLVYLDGSCESL
nr:hypothetical protein CFP56_56527 [Quercus suber]